MHTLVIDQPLSDHPSREAARRPHSPAILGGGALDGEEGRVIWQWIFGKRPVTRPGVTGVERPRSLVDQGVRTNTTVIDQAFWQIMNDVDAPDDAKARLFPMFIEAHDSGDPRREVVSVETAFAGFQWGEKYFELWRVRFKRGTWPHLWQNSSTLCIDPPPPPATIREALRDNYPWRYLTVKDMRKLLHELGAMPAKGEGRPTKRVHFVELLTKTGNTDAIIAAATSGYYEALRRHRSERERDKARILAHTLAMRMYALRDWQEAQSSRHPRRVVKVLKSDCPVERKYAAKFLAGELEGLPPFFPGDRTNLIYDLRP